MTNLCTSHEEFEISLQVATYIFLFIGITGNIATTFLVLFNRSLRRPTYWIVASLAVADLLSIIPFIVIQTDIKVEFYSHFDVIYAGCSFPVTSAKLHVIAISIFRYGIIRRPFHTLTKLTVRRCCAYISCCWLIGLLIGVFNIILIREFMNSPNKLSIFIIVSLFGHLFVPQTILLILQVLKVKTLQKSYFRNIQTTSNIRQLSRMACFIISANIITFLPLSAGTMIVLGCKVMDLEIITCFYIPVTFLFVIIHHCANPIIYFVLSKPWKKCWMKDRKLYTRNVSLISYFIRARRMQEPNGERCD